MDSQYQNDDFIETQIALWEQSRVLRNALKTGTFWENEAWVNDFFDESKISDSMNHRESTENEEKK